MTAYSSNDNAVQEIKDVAQIVDIVGECVALKRSGTNLKGLCPFHSEKTPSFMVNPDRQTFHCFGCDEGGDVFSFMMKYYRLSFPEALKELAKRYNIDLPQKPFSPAEQAKVQKREALFGANERASAIYHEFLLTAETATPARQYLHKRGMTPPVIERFRLGYAPESWNFLGDKLSQEKISPAVAEEAGLLVRKEKGGYYDRFRDRVMFPIFDLTGRAVGFGGRILGDGQPKYLNTSETPIFEKSRILFGLFQHKEAIRKARTAVVVEGNFDLLSLTVHGVDNVVAPLGTALTAAHVRTLKGYADEVVLLFDGDEAGIKAAMRSVPIFLAEQITARVVVLPEDHDPDTYIRAEGKEGLLKLLGAAQPLPEFVFDSLVKNHGLSMEGKGRILEGLRPLIAATANNPLQHSVLISRFSEKLQLNPEQVINAFRKTRQSGTGSTGNITGPQSRRPAAPKAVAVLPRQQQHLLDFLILYPEYLEKFLETGIEDLLTEPVARAILDRLREIRASDQTAGPERLLEIMEAGAERSYVSRLLVRAQIHPGGEGSSMPEKMAEENLAWLARTRLEIERERLTSKIRVAQNKGDEKKVYELSMEIMEINTALQELGEEGEE